MFLYNFHQYLFMIYISALFIIYSVIVSTSPLLIRANIENQLCTHVLNDYRSSVYQSYFLCTNALSYVSKVCLHFCT